VGSQQPAVRRGEVRAAVCPHLRLRAGPRPVRAGPLRRCRRSLPAACALRHGLCLAQLVCPQLVHSPHGRGTGEPRPAVHGGEPVAVPGRPGRGRHRHRDLHRRQLRPQAGRDRRHALRRREQEVHLHRHELPAAPAGRAAHALLSQRGIGRRDGPLLRPVRHRQDHPLHGPRPAADRRRRARLERRGHLQLRGRLLRPALQPLRRARGWWTWTPRRSPRTPAAPTR